MVCAWQGHAGIARMLLHAGADHTAAMTGDNELIGVGPGATALSIADKHKQAAVAKLLRDHATAEEAGTGD